MATTTVEQSIQLGGDKQQEQQEEMATIYPSATFDDATAAEALEKAFRGEKQKAVEILTKICNAQRQMVGYRVYFSLKNCKMFRSERRIRSDTERIWKTS